jgi:hypothetical protein
VWYRTYYAGAAGVLAALRFFLRLATGLSTFFALICLRDEPETCESASALAARLWPIRSPENVPAGDPASTADATPLTTVATVPVVVTAVVLVEWDDVAPAAVADAAAVAADDDVAAADNDDAASAGGLSDLPSPASTSADIVVVVVIVIIIDTRQTECSAIQWVDASALRTA